MLLSIVTRYFDEWFSSPPNEEETTVESTELNQLIQCTRLTILGMCLIENLHTFIKNILLNWNTMNFMIFTRYSIQNRVISLKMHIMLLLFNASKGHGLNGSLCYVYSFKKRPSKQPHDQLQSKYVSISCNHTKAITFRNCLHELRLFSHATCAFVGD